MSSDPAKRLAELVRQAGQLQAKPEHLRAEAEKELFNQVRLGLLVPAALESEEMSPDDMAAMLKLMVSCGQKKRLASRAVENLSKFLASRAWLKVAHKEPGLLEELKAFVENPEADAGDLGALLGKTPSDSTSAGKGAAKPPVLDDASRQLILEPLQEGRAAMAKCGWRFTGDEAGEGFSKFLRGVTRLSGAAGRAELPGASPLLEWLDSDWPKILEFFASMHETKRLTRSQVETCVEKLRVLSPGFAELERNTEGLPWRSRAPAAEAAEAIPEESPPPPPPDGPPEGDVSVDLEPKGKSPGLLGRIFGSKEPSAAPSAPPPPEAVATVIMPKAKPLPEPAEPAPEPKAAAGYPAAAAPPAAKAAAAKAALSPPKAPSTPGVVWVDGNPKSWQSSKLKGHSGIVFQGFDGRDEKKPWLKYVPERASTAARVAVVIMNRRHKSDAAEIRAHCDSLGRPPPRFIVMCREAPAAEVCREWGMQDIHVVHDWEVAADTALREARAAALPPSPRGHSGFEA